MAVDYAIKLSQDDDYSLIVGWQTKTDNNVSAVNLTYMTGSFKWFNANNELVTISGIHITKDVALGQFSITIPASAIDTIIATGVNRYRFRAVSSGGSSNVLLRGKVVVM